MRVESKVAISFSLPSLSAKTSPAHTVRERPAADGHDARVEKAVGVSGANTGTAPPESYRSLGIGSSLTVQSR